MADTTREERIQEIADILMDYDDGHFYSMASAVLDWVDKTVLRGWVKTADRRPKNKDADKDGQIATTYFYKGVLRAITLHWQVVLENPEEHAYWMSLPLLQEVDA